MSTPSCSSRPWPHQSLGHSRAELLPTPESSPQDFTLKALTDCSVSLPAPLAAAWIDDLDRTVVISGPITSAAHVQGCTNCVFVLPYVHQLRIHDCVGCVFVAQTGSGPIIERCDALSFLPCAVPGTPQTEAGVQLQHYPELEHDVAEHVLRPLGRSERYVNKVNAVADFSWLRAQASPHFLAIAASEAAGCLDAAAELLLADGVARRCLEGLRCNNCNEKA
eukprot:gnl/Ergobibamus_cyprinoides/1102.p2 GENE.gnl/Ergobibamus_cyprinoides/1102~~gnl/Ergobibamus_cyprinoides/1102.p2  ORF type:complete len:222 (+),score=25.30 gnl/Ergobibamus_cyprinoides/1102:413-1078(+)